MILHHFRKEFRWLRLRWFVFLALLAFDLAVNLEWLFPLRAGVRPPGWLTYMPWVLMLAGATLLGSCPEDKPGSDRSFISTRPLPLRDYWLARVALWLLLLVIPVVAQTALYLTLSGRPVGAVLGGAWTSLLDVVRLSIWLLPMTALWRRGEFWVALGCLGAASLLADRLLIAVTVMMPNLVPTDMVGSGGRASAALLFALGLLGLAWRHQSRRTAGFLRRLLGMLGVALLGLMAVRFWPWDERGAALDQARVRQLAPALKAEPDLALYEFSGFGDGQRRSMSMPLRAETGAPAVSVVWRPQRSVITQGDYASHSVTPPYWRGRRFDYQTISQTLMAQDAVLRDLFPPGTLFTTGSERSNWNNWWNADVNVADFKAPFPDPDQPLRVTTDFEADWYQRDLELDMPLTPGGAAQSPDHAWRVLQVHENKDENGTPALGHISVELHVESCGPGTPTEADTTLLLYSPQRRMVWLEPAFRVQSDARAAASGWARHTLHLGWPRVLNYADGESAGVDVSQLRLVLLRNRFLGTSSWTWKSPDIRLRDHPSTSHQPYFRDQQIYAGREIKAFRERLATLKPPAPDAPESQVRRYLYDLLAVTNLTRAAEQPAVLKEVAEAFRPLMQHHLPLLLELPGSVWPGWSDAPPTSLLEEYLTEAQRETAIDLVLTNSRLPQIVINKGWAEEARRLQPQLLARPRLPWQTHRLLLQWADEASHEKLMRELQRFPEWDTFMRLDKIPALRPRLEEIARGITQHDIPLLRSQSYTEATHQKLAADFGSAASLDVCLRWMALGGDLPTPGGITPRPRLLKADGSKLWEEKVDSDKQWPRYRHLKPADFDYLPEQRAWRLRQP